MAAPTEKELELIPKFRELISDLGLDTDQNSDAHLLRWLRARDLNLKKAEEMIRNAMKWRKENDIENIHTWKAPDWIVEEFPYMISGFTKKNTPIIILPYGSYDLKKVVNGGHKDDFVKYIVQYFERGLQETRNKVNPLTNYPSTQITLLVDATNYAYSQYSSSGVIGLLIEVLKIFDNYYPEFLDTCYIVNAPALFSVLFNIIKPFMAKKTVEKYQIYSGESKWKPILMNDILEDQLPPKYGGTGHTLVINQRGERRSAYPVDTAREMKFIQFDSKIHSISIKPGENMTLYFNILQPNTALSLNVKVEKNDIGLSIVDGNNQEIFPYKKTIEIENEKILFKEPGPYYLTLDNSYSKVRSKNVKIQVDYDPDTK